MVARAVNAASAMLLEWRSKGGGGLLWWRHVVLPYCFMRCKVVPRRVLTVVNR